MQRRPLILVDWEDIAYDPSWHREDALDDCSPLLCHTVGWRMKSGKGFLRVAATRSSGVKKCADITSIPNKNIRNIRRLE